jgi:hypothetical protein
VDVVIRPKSNSTEVIESWDAVASVGTKVFAAEVNARKPGACGCCCGSGAEREA